MKKGLLPLAITVLHHGGVLHKGNVTSSLHQASEGSSVAVEVLHGIPVKRVNSFPSSILIFIEITPRQSAFLSTCHSSVPLYHGRDRRGGRSASSSDPCTLYHSHIQGSW